MENKQTVSVRMCNFVKKNFGAFFLFLLIGFSSHSQSLHGASYTEPTTMTYYLYIADFAGSFIQIPSSTISGQSSTSASSYLAGDAPIYDVNNQKVGTCSASFLSIQNGYGIYTDILNFLSVANGLIVSWITPTKLLNLELDSIVNGMVTECTVVSTTKVGFAPFFGQTFNLIVSSDNERIYFQFSRIGTIF